MPNVLIQCSEGDEVQYIVNWDLSRAEIDGTLLFRLHSKYIVDLCFSIPLFAVKTPTPACHLHVLFCFLTSRREVS